MIGKLRSSAIALVLVLSVGVAPAATLYVDANASPGGDGSAGAPFKTIRLAIFSASSGDTVEVLPGTYRESIVMRDGLRLKSSSGPEVTIIDGSGFENSVVSFMNVGPTTTLEGFTITGGHGDRAGMIAGVPIYRGGGIQIINSSPTLIGNHIVGNSLTEGIARGGGIYINNVMQKLTLIGNVVSGNVARSAEHPEAGVGGGIYLTSKFSSATISENLIELNVSGTGGGIWMQDEVALQRNVIRDNQAEIGAGVFANVFAGFSTTVVNNVFRGNSSDGGVIDCDDSDPDQTPGSVEICNDGKDNDCDPATPDLFDLDGDGYTCEVDCDDNDASVNPGKAERCNDYKDNDCDGSIDLVSPENVILVQEGSSTRYLANAGDPGLALTWTDPLFDDSGWTAAAFGIGFEAEIDGAQELLNEVVPTSSASVYTRTRFQIDDPLSVNAMLFGADYDDGLVVWLNGVEIYRSPEMPAGDPVWDAAPAAHESSNGDDPDYGTLVDVSTPALPVLLAGENILGIGIYANDPGADADLVLVPRLSMSYGVDDADCLCPDNDGDGYACTDCQDADADVHPGAGEICDDGVDNDCNVATPDIVDADGDGATCDVDCDDTTALARPGLAEIACDDLDNDCNPATPDVVDADGDFFSCLVDCDDGNPAIKPTTIEFCFDSLDNDCDGLIDSADEECSCGNPVDADMDGYRCTDCDDGNPNVNPGEAEICNDGIDNDCNNLTLDVFDNDGDGSTCEVDCRDFDPAVNPLAPERCDDGLDTDCDGMDDLTDPDCACPDADVDGYACLDCNDADPAINPGSSEICNDGIDNDCDPTTIDLPDLDGDGAACDVDCDDTDPEINPTAAERCFDLIDNDCDGLVDIVVQDLTLLAEGKDIRWLANLSDPGLGLTWTGTPFDDSAWSPGLYGVGYQVGVGGAENLIQTEVPQGSASVYTRARFDIGVVAALSALFISADYDDAYVVWINGTEVYRSPEMPAGVPTWDANPGLHESSNAADPVYGTPIDISTAALPVIVEGTNVLAVGVYNDFPANGGISSDLVLVPRLSATYGNDDPDCFCPDIDGDGYSCTDCNDSLANVNPGRNEVGCDGIDNDCNPATVDDYDLDGDGYTCSVDCDDQDETTNPGTPEVACDGVDNDCNPGTSDIRDDDFDTFTCLDDCDDQDASVNPSEPEISCDGIDNDCSTQTADVFDADGDGFACDVECDDSDPGVSPGAAEKCDDGVDTDCDGLDDMSDPDCACADGDGDGYACLDCNDADAAINPGAAEICNDTIDNDCNPGTGDVDDLDGDGYDCLSDCNDGSPFVRPGAAETCNDGIDNDCDPMTLDLYDNDGDTYTCDVDCDDNSATTHPGAPEVCDDGIDNDCNPISNDVFNADGDSADCRFDCDDGDNTIFPGAVEVCNDGIDNDCDPATPDVFDGDGDGTLCDLDCDDADPSRSLDAFEQCIDGVDNDCDGDTDNADADCSCTDGDGDGYECQDCDDGDASVHPGLAEICNDGKDNDCDVATPDVADFDGDGFLCTLDCDDADATVNPSMPEICGDGKDNDCSAGTPDLEDVDNDTFQCDVDCDDSNPAVYPGRPEVGCDGIDNDCDPMTLDTDDGDGDSITCVDPTVHGAGFAAMVYSTGRLTLVNNTVIGNNLTLGTGGGLWVDDSSSTAASVVENNVLYDNAALLGGGFDHTLFTGQVASNAFFANAGGDLYDATGASTVAVDNLFVDPGFASVAYDNFRPAPGSPLIDAANPTTAPINDLDRVPRPYDGDGDMTALPDLGAYEYPSAEVFNVRFVSHTAMTWDVRPGETRFNVYRGDLRTLRLTGVYTQDPALANPEQFCDFAAASLPFVDTYVPPSPRHSFYLVTVTSDTFEGSLGQDGVGALRANTRPCP